MALISADRVKETTTTTGTGSITLAGASTGFKSFSSGVGTGNTCYYAIVAQSPGEWEVGLGTLSGATTLARTTVYASSNAGSLVTFSAGTKDVFVTLPATKTAQLDASGNFTLSGTLNATTLQQGGVGVSLVGHTHSYEPTITAGTTAQYWRGDKSWQTLDKTAVGLGSVDNVSINSWTGSTNIVTVGTIATGTWNATAIADGKIASALTGKTYNGLTLTAAATGFTIAGGTTSKTLTLSNTITLAGTDSSTLNIGSGGTLGTAAYTASTAYLAIGGGTLTGDLTLSNADPELTLKDTTDNTQVRLNYNAGWFQIDHYSSTPTYLGHILSLHPTSNSYMYYNYATVYETIPQGIGIRRSTGTVTYLNLKDSSAVLEAALETLAGYFYISGKVNSQQVVLRGKTTGAVDSSILVGDPNGSVSLYYANANKLSTTSTGITVAGQIVVSADPTTTLQVATKQYVDNNAGMTVEKAISLSKMGII